MNWLIILIAYFAIAIILFVIMYKLEAHNIVDEHGYALGYADLMIFYLIALIWPIEIIVVLLYRIVKPICSWIKNIHNKN